MLLVNLASREPSQDSLEIQDTAVSAERPDSQEPSQASADTAASLDTRESADSPAAIARRQTIRQLLRWRRPAMEISLLQEELRPLLLEL